MRTALCLAVLVPLALITILAAVAIIATALIVHRQRQGLSYRVRRPLVNPVRAAFVMAALGGSWMLWIYSFHAEILAFVAKLQ